MNSIEGIQVHTNPNLVIIGPPTEVKLTWRERWWRPWKRVKVIRRELMDVSTS